MPQCPHCHAEFEPSQRYCKVCGSYLLDQETGDTFCPQCGIRVSPRQEFCHECDAPLKEEAAPAQPSEKRPQAAPPPAPPASPLAALKGVPPWMLGVLIALGVIIVILVIVLFLRPGATPPAGAPPAPKVEAPSPPAPAPQPAAPPETAAPAPPAPEAAPDQETKLKEELMPVLNNMRDARTNKNIIQLMNCYSVNFPNLEEKRRETLKAWESYDYTNLVYTIDEVKLLDPDNAIANITWYVDVRNRRTGELSSSTQTYQVRFAKELGQWRIRSLEETE